MSTTAAAPAALQMLPLAKITPSPMNPRKTFDSKALEELAESIRTHGVLQPIVVRPNGRKDDFEIVVGERRWRASKLAGKSEIPALVQPMSNAEALEAMVIENLQRDDVHPLEEAAGYQALLAKRPEGVGPTYTVEAIAAKVGKSVSYVYQRLKLATLIQYAADAFRAGHITAGHAILIARLEPKDQLRALRACFDEWGGAPIEKLIQEAFSEYGSGCIPEKELRVWIQENVNLDLKKAAWKLDDADLVPDAGACTACPKRSANNPALFADMVDGKRDVCMDPDCYRKKQQAFVAIKTAELGDKGKAAVRISEKHSYTKPKEGAKLLRAGQWVEAKPGSCPAVATGVFVDGETAGTTRSVCGDPSCKVHRHSLQSASTRESDDPAKRAADEAKAAREREVMQKLRRRIFDTVRAKQDGLSRQGLLVLLGGMDLWDLEGLLKLRGWKGKPEKVLREKLATLPPARAFELLIECVLYRDVTDPYLGRLGSALEDAAAAWKIDVAKLRNQIQSELAAASDKPAAAKAKGKKQ